MDLMDSALITLQNVKDYVSIQGRNPEQDDELKRLINRVTTLFHTECNRIFKSDTYTEYYDGRDHYVIYLNQYPISSITSLYDDVDWDWDSDTLIDSDDYRISVNSDAIILKDYNFASGKSNIKVTYVAGFTTIPYDIEQACIEEVARKWNNRKQIDVTSRSKAEGDVTYIQKGLMPVTVKTLKKYKRYSYPL